MPVISTPDDQPLFGGGAQIVFGGRKPPAIGRAAPRSEDNPPPKDQILLTERLEDAFAYASALHREQRRKGTCVPYVSHLLGVASLALEMGGDEDQAIAALLHDAVEDQGGEPRLGEIRERFGTRVANIVADCTESEKRDDGTRASWRDRKQAWVASLVGKPDESVLVALADKTHNVRAILDDLEIHGASVWDRFAGHRDGSLWYYTELSRVFRRIYPGAASQRFAKFVEHLAQDF